MPEMTLQLTVNQLHDTHRLAREWDTAHPREA